jgi:hypothetical protein
MIDDASLRSSARSTTVNSTLSLESTGEGRSDKSDRNDLKRLRNGKQVFLMINHDMKLLAGGNDQAHVPKRKFILIWWFQNTFIEIRFQSCISI